MWLSAFAGCFDYNVEPNDPPNAEVECPAVGVAEQIAATCLDPYGPLEIEQVWTYEVPMIGCGGVSVGPLFDSNDDGAITGLDQPFVVIGGSVGDDHDQYAAVNGADGTLLWKTSRNRYVSVAPGLLVDLDGDGVVEVLVSPGIMGEPTHQLVALDGRTGAERWRSVEVPFDIPLSDSLAAADLNGDGTPEIIDGRLIFGSEGQLVAEGEFGSGGIRFDVGVRSRQSFGVDVDEDLLADVLAGASAYSWDGSALWNDAMLPDGHPLAADFDGDGSVDIVLTSGDQMWGLYGDGKVAWGPVEIDGGCSEGVGAGPAAAEDLDEDGLPEFVVPCGIVLSAFEWGGGVLWQAPIDDYGMAAGAAIADLDGDGRPEVAFGGERAISVFAGGTGALRWSAPRSSTTIVETPVFADVDLDGRIEMIVASNGELRAYRSNPAGHGRNAWNSHSYHIADINDDMTVPAVSERYWETTNSFRSAGLGDRLPDTDPYPVFLDVCQLRCDRGTVVITATVANGGHDEAPPGLEVVVRAGPSGAIVARMTTTAAIPGYSVAGALRFEVAVADLAGHAPTLEVDPADTRLQCLTMTDDDAVTWASPVCEGE